MGPPLTDDNGQPPACPVWRMVLPPVPLATLLTAIAAEIAALALERRVGRPDTRAEMVERRTPRRESTP